MSSTAERWRNLADQLTTTIASVPPERWDNPTPCPDWKARDVVRHLVDWMPALYFGSAKESPPDIPSVDTDPLAAWRAADTAIYAMLTDPQLSARPTDSPAGRLTVEDLVAMTGLPDLLVHRWDLARATGQDEHLDAGEVAALVAGIRPEMTEPMVASGHFQPPVEVADDADDQTRLLAFMGRRA